MPRNHLKVATLQSAYTLPHPTPPHASAAPHPSAIPPPLTPPPTPSSNCPFNAHLLLILLFLAYVSPVYEYLPLAFTLLFHSSSSSCLAFSCLLSSLLLILTSSSSSSSGLLFHGYTLLLLLRLLTFLSSFTCLPPSAVYSRHASTLFTTSSCGFSWRPFSC